MGAASWSADANRSTIFNVNAAQVPVAAAVWSLPIATADIAQAGEAAHGGSVSLLLRGEGLTSRLPGTASACKWLDTVLTANARWLEMKG